MMMWLFPNLLPRRIGLPASWAIWGIKAEIHLSPNWVLPIVQGSTQNSFLSSNCLAQVSRNVFFCEFSATHTVDSSRFNNDHAYFSKSILHVRITYPARLNAFQGSRASWKEPVGSEFKQTWTLCPYQGEEDLTSWGLVSSSGGRENNRSSVGQGHYSVR